MGYAWNVMDYVWNMYVDGGWGDWGDGECWNNVGPRQFPQMSGFARVYPCVFSSVGISVCIFWHRVYFRVYPCVFFDQRVYFRVYSLTVCISTVCIFILHGKTQCSRPRKIHTQIQNDTIKNTRKNAHENTHASLYARDSGAGIYDSRAGIIDSGAGIIDSGTGIIDSSAGIYDSGARIYDSGGQNL